MRRFCVVQERERRTASSLRVLFNGTSSQSDWNVWLDPLESGESGGGGGGGHLVGL